jgi:hypothetical protein
MTLPPMLARRHAHCPGFEPARLPTPGGHGGVDAAERPRCAFPPICSLYPRSVSAPLLV